MSKAKETKKEAIEPAVEVEPAVEPAVEAVEEKKEKKEKKHELVGKHIGGKEIISVEIKNGRTVATDEAGCTYLLSEQDIADYVK